MNLKKILSVFMCMAMLGTANVYAASGVDGSVAGGVAGGVTGEAGGETGDGTVSGEVGTDSSYSYSDGTFEYYISDGKATVEGLVYKINPEEYGDGIYTIPDSVDGATVTTVDYEAFQNNSHIVEITLPKTITYIDSWAFTGCSNLRKLTVLSYDLEMWGTVISNCSSDFVLYGYKYSPVYEYAQLNEISFESIGDMPRIIVDSGTVNDDISWTYDNYERLTISGTGAMPDYTNSTETPWTKYVYMGVKEAVIEDGITYVGAYMCYYSDTLEKITVAGSVKSIGESAFGSCVKLTEVNLNEGLETIGRSAIGGISESITIPSTIKDIEEYGIACNTMKGLKDSYAESYAQSQGIEFEAVGEAPINEVYVTTTEELIDAIASNTVITMADGVYILDNTVEIEEDDYTYHRDCIEITNILNLTIKAENPGKVEILAMQKDESEKTVDTMIFRISECDDIVFDGIRMGNREVKTSPYESLEKSEVQIFGGYMGYVHHYGIYVEYAEMPNDVSVINCDIFNCTYAIHYWDEGFGTLEIRDTVLRDSYIAAVWTNSFDFVMDGCTVSRSGCSEEYKDYYCVFADNTSTADGSNSSAFTNNTFINNSNEYCYWTGAEESTESGTVSVNNVWDNQNPEAYGICKNGITWQVVASDNGNILKLGYDITKNGTAFESSKGKVYPYTAYSEPWRDFDITLVDLAEGVTLSSDISSIVINKTDYKTSVLIPISSWGNNKLIVTGYNPENSEYIDVRMPNDDLERELTFDCRAKAVKVFLWDSLNGMKPVCDAVKLN